MDVTRESIAEMLAIYVCVSRQDLRASALNGSWLGWNDLLLDDELDNPTAHDATITYREGIFQELSTPGADDVLQALHDRIDLSWRPPCPKKGAIDAAFNAMCDYYNV